MIIQEQPLQVLRGLAVAIGLNEAIVLQQVYWLLQDPRNGKSRLGHRWLYNTYEEWREQFFPFWSERTLRRVFDQLETMQLLVSCQPEGAVSRRKWYRINTGMLQQLTEERIPEAAKMAGSKRPRRPLPISREDSSEKDLSKGSKETSEVSDAHSFEEEEHPALWIPDNRPKEVKLKSIRTPKDIPSEVEFNRFLESEGLDATIHTYRPDLYGDLSNRKWHHWNEQGRKWVRIRDWKSYVHALADKIDGNDF